MTKWDICLCFLFKCRRNWEAYSKFNMPGVLSKITDMLYVLFFRTYFDNIVAIDSLLEHIMVCCLVLQMLSFSRQCMSDTEWGRGTLERVRHACVVSRRAVTCRVALGFFFYYFC